MFHAVGRRKSAVARVWLKSGNGKITVNGKDYSQYFPTDFHKENVRSPLETLGCLDVVDVNLNIDGGGCTGQADAAKLAIARALILVEPAYRPVLKAGNYLTVDARVVERKKPGRKKARRRFQFVKR